MPKWRKGQSGNPDGKAMTASLRRQAHDYALNEDGDPIIEHDQDGKAHKIKNLDKVARQLLAKAKKGDVNAIQEVFNRLDGKVANVNVEIPVKPLEEYTRDELLRIIAGVQDDRGAEGDSSLSRAKPAGNA